MLFLGHLVEDLVGNSQGGYDVGVQDADAAGSNGAHGEFFVTWDAEFSHDADVERHAQGVGHLVADRYSAPGEGEDEHVGASLEAP